MTEEDDEDEAQAAFSCDKDVNEVYVSELQRHPPNERQARRHQSLEERDWRPILLTRPRRRSQL